MNSRFLGGVLDRQRAAQEPLTGLRQSQVALVRIPVHQFSQLWDRLNSTRIRSRRAITGLAMSLLVPALGRARMYPRM